MRMSSQTYGDIDLCPRVSASKQMLNSHYHPDEQFMKNENSSSLGRFKMNF